MAASIKEEVCQSGVRRRCRIKGEKLCQVCGDKALAHHFGALACETCKAFFRRNALRQNEVKTCSEGRNCLIDKNSRRVCPWCRMQKCLDVGMKAELIFGVDQKKKLKEKVKRNKMQSKHCSSFAATELPREHASPPFVSSSAVPMMVSQMVTDVCAQAGTSSCSAPYKVDGSVSQERSAVSESVLVEGVSSSLAQGNLPNLEHMVLNASSAACQSKESLEPLEGCCLGGMTKDPKAQSCSQANTSDSPPSIPSSENGPVVVEQKKGSLTDLRTLTRDQLPSDPHMYWRLSEEERMLLTLMSAAYEDTILVSLRERQTSAILDSSDFGITDFLSDCDIQVRNAVSFVKRLEDFRRLNFDDQIACFKSSIGSVMAVRNAYIFVAERNAWLMIKGQMTEELCKSLFPYNPYLGWGTELCRELKAVIKNDITIYALLHCILLFNPSSEKVADRQMVSTMRDKYVVLLRHYLEATFSYVYSEDYVRVLQNIVLEFGELNRVSTKLAKEMHCPGSDDCVRFELLMELHDEADK
ncbi:vitamin D3 receptor B-like isoform X2 [Littorina saxatilis]|uniref:vitamin D3 receptor B-like isoform X2 n=1 Tax=Littorina saxatilis TaxID=31220 RepID=UPI0038B46716